MLVFTLWVAAAGFLFAGYAVGRQAWQEKFAVRLEGRGTISGKWTELAVITYTALLVTVVDNLTPDADLPRLVAGNWLLVAALGVLVYAIVLFHSRRVVKNLPAAEESYEHYRRDLARGYAIYNLFSTIIFGYFLMTGAVVVQQFIADHAEFVRNREILDAALTRLSTIGVTAAATPSAVQAQVEQVNSLLIGSIQTIVEQINTVFLVFFFVLAINFLIEFTPVRSAYSAEGVSTTHLCVVLVLVLVLLIGWYIYYTQYLGLMRQAIAAVAGAEERVITDDWELMRRYYEVLNDLRGKQGITGFALMLSTERGGLLLLLGALQFMFTERKRYGLKPKGDSDAAAASRP
ncbi:MAG: hypothetical protein AB7G35_22145 [Hyphomicrobiaceae bacterium]